MDNCGPRGGSDPDYSVATGQTAGQDPGTLRSPTDVGEWMRETASKFGERRGGYATAEAQAIPAPQGYGYVAKTIRYDSGRGLIQTGSAPGYHGGAWTLASCKHHMRGWGTVDRQFEAPDADGRRHPKAPFFLATFASRAKGGSNDPVDPVGHESWLASIALVTAGFDETEAMADYIEMNCSDEALNHRRTGASDAPYRAERMGDLHVDEGNRLVYPQSPHQHSDEEEGECDCSPGSEGDGLDPQAHNDNDPEIIKLLSETGYWVAWGKPTLYYDGGAPRTGPKLDGEYETLTEKLESIE